MAFQVTGSKSILEIESIISFLCDQICFYQELARKIANASVIYGASEEGSNAETVVKVDKSALAQAEEIREKVDQLFELRIGLETTLANLKSDTKFDFGGGGGE